MSKDPKQENDAAAVDDNFNAVHATAPKFKWLLNTSDIRDFDKPHAFSADPDQLDEIRLHLGLDDLTKFQIRCLLSVRPTNDDLLDLQLHLKANGKQACVISGNPISFRRVMSEELVFTTKVPRRRKDADLQNPAVHLEEDDLDAPEVLHEKLLDVLHLGIEILSLDLDPFPRCDEASFENLDDSELEDDRPIADIQDAAGSGENELDKKPNPFAALQGLKDRMS